MFARPQTAHAPRYYSINTTKKTLNKDKENAGALPSKTPSRGGLGKMLVPNTTFGRTVGKDLGKGKGKDIDDIAPKRLFASTSTSTKQLQVVASKSFGNLQTIRSNKTPAKSQVRAPAPVPVPVPAMTTPLPSASKPRRSRRSLSISLTPSLGKMEAQPSTPAPKQWEEGESLESITEGLNELAMVGEVEELEEEGDGEVEYMPPRAEPLPYQSLGYIECVADDFKAFHAMPPLWTWAKEPPPPPLDDIDEAREWSLGISSDDELEEPMFRQPKVAAVPAISITRPASSISTSTLRKPIFQLTAAASRSMTRTPRTVPTPSRLAKPPIARTATPSRPLASLGKPPSRTRAVPPIPARSVQPDLSYLLHDIPDVEPDLDFGFSSDSEA